MEVRSLSAYESLIPKIVGVEKIVKVCNIVRLVSLIDCVIVLYDITQTLKLHSTSHCSYNSTILQYAQHRLIVDSPTGSIDRECAD